MRCLFEKSLAGDYPYSCDEPEMEKIDEGLLGAIGKGISAIQRGWNNAKQDYKDARMSGQLHDMDQRLADYRRRQQMLQQQRQKWQQFQEDPNQFQRTNTSQELTKHNVANSQYATVNAKTAHEANVQAQDLADTKDAALKAGTDMKGNTPAEAMKVQKIGSAGHDPDKVDDALYQIQNYVKELNTTTDPNRKAELLNLIYQASSAGAEQMKGRLDALGAASAGGQTIAMKDGRNNRLTTHGRRKQVRGGRPRGGLGARKP